MVLSHFLLFCSGQLLSNGVTGCDNVIIHHGRYMSGAYQMAIIVTSKRTWSVHCSRENYNIGLQQRLGMYMYMHVHDAGSVQKGIYSSSSFYQNTLQYTPHKACFIGHHPILTKIHSQKLNLKLHCLPDTSSKELPGKAH